MRPRLALVPGEPAGVGPELCVRLAQRERAFDLVAFADGDTLVRAARALDLPLTLRDPDAGCAPGELALQPVPQVATTEFGRPDAGNAGSTIAALTRAADACRAGDLHGMVTGPVHKAAINAGGIAYAGTTELLAAHAGTDVVMMLATSPFFAAYRPSTDGGDDPAAPLRVALATTHLPLRAVPDAITGQGLTRTLRIVRDALRRDFGIATPRIAVLGLNPHAGEDGHLGREEIDVIVPVLEALRAEGFALEGPLPADTAFLPHRLRGCDAVLAMYHDQGLPVLKFSGFERAVNVTLGLTYPRVAVDHGTALELAGKGEADPSSLFAATDLCAELARRRASL